ncbi:MAG: hypothetical protein N3D18_06405 [Roseococcus sp.]|nr:hypothetical protein [Roseococcus sp.]
MRWRAGLGLAALIMAGVALAQPSSKLHLTPPGAQPATPPKGGPQAAPTQPPAPAPPPRQASPAWPPLPPRLAQEPPALERLRGLLDAGIELGYRAAGQEGEVLTLTGVELRRGAERMLMERLVLEGLSAEGLRRGAARGVSAEFPEGRVRLAEFDLEALALLPLRPGQTGGEREPDQIAVSGLRLAGLELEGETGVWLRTFVLAGWQPGRPGQLGVEGLRVRLPAGSPVTELRVERAGLEGLDLAAMAAAAARNSPPPAPPAGRQAYRVDGVSVARDGQALGGLGRLVVEGQTEADGAAAGRLTVHDAALEHFPEVAAALDAVGLRRLSMELAIEASWTPRNGRFELPALAFGVRELGALAVAWVMEGVDPAAAMSDPNRVSLIEARLRYADQSLYERALRDQAQRERTTPERIRQQHAQMVAAMLTPARPDPEVDAVRSALLRFIGGQAREVEIALRPARAVTMTELQPLLSAGPSEVVRGLGITATAR